MYVKKYYNNSLNSWLDADDIVHYQVKTFSGLTDHIKT